MPEEKKEVSYKLINSDGTTRQMGEIPVDDAKKIARVASEEDAGVKLVRWTKDQGGVDINFKE